MENERDTVRENDREAVGETVFVTVTVLEKVEVTVVVTVTVFETDATETPDTDVLVDTAPAPMEADQLWEIPLPKVADQLGEIPAKEADQLGELTTAVVVMDQETETGRGHILRTRALLVSAMTTVGPVPTVPC